MTVRDYNNHGHVYAVDCPFCENTVAVLRGWLIQHVTQSGGNARCDGSGRRWDKVESAAARGDGEQA